VIGTEVIKPTATLVIERRYNRSQWWSKAKMLSRKVGKVNQGAFEGYGEEEVLFSGARIQRYRRYASANLEFLISPSDSVDIADIGTISKKGWRYLWVLHREDSESGIGVKPLAAFQARVYQRTAFSDLL